VQGANGQAVVYDGTSDHARRVGFDPNKLQQIPAEQSFAATEQNTLKNPMVAQEVSNKAAVHRSA
jgi:hypothetical protein